MPEFDEVPEDIFDFSQSLGSEMYSLSEEQINEIVAKYEALRDVCAKYDVPVLAATITGVREDDNAELLGLVHGRLTQMPPSMFVIYEMISRESNARPLHLQLLALSVITALKETGDREFGEALLDMLKPIFDAYDSAELHHLGIDPEDIAKRAGSIMKLFDDAFKEEIEKGWTDDRETDRDDD